MIFLIFTRIKNILQNILYQEKLGLYKHYKSFKSAQDRAKNCGNVRKEYYSRWLETVSIEFQQISKIIKVVLYEKKLGSFPVLPSIVASASPTSVTTCLVYELLQIITVILIN